MNQVLERIGQLKLVPVVKIKEAAQAQGLGKALLDGGLPVAEITFRTDAAEEAIRILSESFPEMLVGAGTVLTTENVDKAARAGAQFIVAPGFNPTVVDYCLQQQIPVIPGVNSPTQIEMGLERGLEVLKFFPAEASGGIKLLQAMAAPYAGVRFMPTGGISPGNLADYLALEEVLACGGTWIAKTDAISAGRFAEITRVTQEAVALLTSI